MLHTTTSSISAADRHWVLVRCGGLFTHYRPIHRSTVLLCTRSGGYEGCGLVIQPSEFPEATHGDEVTIYDGVLKYGIDPAARSPIAARKSSGGPAASPPANSTATSPRSVPGRDSRSTPSSLTRSVPANAVTSPATA